MRRNIHEYADYKTTNSFSIVFIICSSIMLIGYLSVICLSINSISIPIRSKALHIESGVPKRQNNKKIKKSSMFGLASSKKDSGIFDSEVPHHCKDMSQAFITAGKEDVISEITYLVKSVHLFSAYCIIVYFIDFPNDYVLYDISSKIFPRLVQRISVSITGDEHALYAHVIQQSQLERGIWLEPNSIVNYNIDELFKIFNDPLLSRGGNVLTAPLFPLHPCIPESAPNAMEEFNVPTQTMPYVQPSSPILFTRESIDFLNRFLIILQEWGLDEEIAINLFLWQNKIKAHLTQVNPLLSQFQCYLDQTEIEYIPHWWMSLPDAEMWFVLFRGVPPDWGREVYGQLKRHRMPAYYRNGEWYSGPKRSAIYGRGYRSRNQCECQSEECEKLQIFSSFRNIKILHDS